MDNELEKIKQKLRSYTRKDLIFHEPHFTQRLSERGESREEVISHLLNPDQLIYFKKETGKYGDTKYALYFELSPNRTLLIPIIFDINDKKRL